MVCSSMCSSISVGATDVEGSVIADAGHWLAEQAPQDLLAVMTPFLAPYRAEHRLPAPA